MRDVMETTAHGERPRRLQEILRPRIATGPLESIEFCREELDTNDPVRLAWSSESKTRLSLVEETFLLAVFGDTSAVRNTDKLK